MGSGSGPAVASGSGMQQADGQPFPRMRPHSGRGQDEPSGRTAAPGAARRAARLQEADIRRWTFR